jgi:indoleacetamide hydrolase
MENAKATASAARAPNFDRQEDLGVAGAAAAIRNGDITSEAYSSTLLDRARRYSDLNSFITIDEPAVLEAAREADKARAAGSTAPLLGVPLAVKDSYLTRGLRTTIGMGMLEKFVPTEDANTVRAIKDAGGIVFGKNNLVEMSYGLTGDNAGFGQVKNPYGDAHVPGGSSSGSGASVAARLVPAALGGDTVGSIRVPASLCGVVGFKPTTGRWNREGVVPISHTLDTTGVFARSVEDCALIDQVITKSPAAMRSNRADLKGTKFAYAPRQYLALVDPEVEAHFKDTLRRLRDAGAEVIEIDLGEDFRSLAERATWNIFFHETMPDISEFLAQKKLPVSFDQIYDKLKSEIKDLWTEMVLPSGSAFTSEETYKAALHVERPEIQRRFAEIFAHHRADAFVFPTTPCVAPSIEHRMQFTIAGHDVSYLVLAQNTVPTSGAGLPGVSVPIGQSNNNLPIGIEIDGAHGADRALLGLAQRVQTIIGYLPAPF